ncbi:50S ribosomal protein L19 [Patescibacteria group bacterium]|nr:50S ribosomal protein L19 [Patescibacteria group bacterium]
MSNLLIQEIEKKFINKKMPVLRPGYQVRVHQKIKEGEKERIQVFEGMVVGLNSGHVASKTFTVRKVVQGIAVEKIFPVNSPLIAKIEVKKTFGIRRAKLNFIRGASGMSKRLSAKLGLTEKDETHRKKKGMHEEEEAVEEAGSEAEEVVTAEAGGATVEEAPVAAAEEAPAKAPEEPAKEE